MKKYFSKTVPISGRVRVCLDLVKEQNIKGKVILDIGSSFGWLEKEIIKFVPKKLVGVEMDEGAVKFAKKNIKGASFLVGTALDIPLPKNFADLICFFDVLEHVPKGAEFEVLDEITRVLKKGGKLLFSTPNNNLFSNIFDIAWYFGHRHYSKAQVTKLLQNRGFKIEKIMVCGSVLSSLYLTWFYIAKRIFNTPQPRNRLFEWLDDLGYRGNGITDIFIVVQKS